MIKEKSVGSKVIWIFPLIIVLCSLLVVSCFSALTDDDLLDTDLSDIIPLTDTTVSSDGGPLVLAHYMPWYEAPPITNTYGGHWTGWGYFNPPSEIASHHMPLTGPYDSRDPKVLEYQAELMKRAGIDGVIFDWYGIHNVNDYKSIHDSTLAMIKVLKEKGMKFVICYEDQTVPAVVKNTGKTSERVGQETFAWMQKNWFRDDAYVRIEGRPVVMCFGPQHFSKSQWDAAFSVTKPRPYFVDLDNKTTWAESTYNWPPMWASENLAGGLKGELTIPRLQQYLDEFYVKNANKAYRVASAFPAFDDIYEDQGGKSYGNLDYADGATFELTFEAAEAFNPHIIQIATWNDYGEGTIIEPTEERGYTSLEYLQDKQKEWNPDFPYDYDDLREPLEQFNR